MSVRGISFLDLDWEKAMNQTRSTSRLAALSLTLILSSLALACAVSAEDESQPEAELDVPDERAASAKYGVQLEDVEVSDDLLGETDGALERIVVNSTECSACADDEWGAYVRKCCITTNAGKSCWQEACKKPVEEDLPLDPGDSSDPSTRPPSAPIDPIFTPSVGP
jgi:hypothetical protein